MEDIILQADGLSVSRHDGSTPVRELCFRLRRGAILGVIGESGAGKSSLALALTGLHDRREVSISGSLTWKGRELVGLSERQWLATRGREMGMIFQDPVASLNPSLRIDRQVAATIRHHADFSRREARVRAASLLAETGISRHLLETAPYAHQLSGGLAQRAMIALALAGEPELLVADEPTSSLDVTSQAAIISLLRRRQRQLGLTMVFISHDLALVASLADEILVMKSGECVDYGRSDDIITCPSHPYTSSLIEAWRAYQRPREESAASA